MGEFIVNIRQLPDNIIDVAEFPDLDIVTDLQSPINGARHSPGGTIVLVQVL